MKENEWFRSETTATLTHPEREKLILALNFWGIHVPPLVSFVVSSSSSGITSPAMFVRRDSELLLMFPDFALTGKELHTQDLLDIIELSCV